MKGKASADGSAQVGYAFSDSGAMNRGPAGSRWCKLPAVGADLNALQLDEFQFGLPLRFAIDPTSKKGDAVSVWSSASDTFIGFLAKSCNAEVAWWIQNGGATGFITCEFWPSNSRSSLGILCMPAEQFEVVIEGPRPESAKERLAVLAKEREAILKLVPKFCGMLSKAVDKGLTRAAALKMKDVVDQFESDCFDLERDDFVAEDLLELLTSYGFATTGVVATRDLAEDLGSAAGSISTWVGDISEEWSEWDADEREANLEDAELAIEDLLSLLEPDEGTLGAVGAVSKPAAANGRFEGIVLTDDAVAPPTDPSLPPAAWYDDPSTSGQYRYWDGAVWTPHTAPK